MERLTGDEKWYGIKPAGCWGLLKEYTLTGVAHGVSWVEVLLEFLDSSVVGLDIWKAAGNLRERHS